VHTVLLQGQGVTVQRPARSAGTVIGIALAGIALALSLALLSRGLGWPVSWPQFIAYAGAGVMAIVALTFAFWAYAGATMRYIVSTAGITIRWGPIRHHIPITRIQLMIRGKGEERPKVRGVSWFGYHVGRGEVGDEKRVLFFSTHSTPQDIVYIRTEDAIYAVSPQDTSRFITDSQKAYEASRTDQPAGPLVERDFVAAHPIWSDRIAQGLMLISIVTNLALWAYIFASYPDLSNEITIEFPPIGEITTLHSREAIFRIPGTASAILAVNLVTSLLFQPRERAASYLLLSGTIFLQVVFWVAAVVAIVNA
jgi:hypothetical protein